MSFMRIFPWCRLVFGVLITCVFGIVFAQGSDTLWRLQINDLDHKVRVDATIRLAKQEAPESCLDAVRWKRVIVEKTTMSSPEFFPLHELLAYSMKDQKIALGRTGVCDGYRILIAKWSKSRVAGEYIKFGLGNKEKQGTFTLAKIQRRMSR